MHAVFMGTTASPNDGGSDAALQSGGVLKAPIHYAFSSGSRQYTRCTYVQQTRSMHALVNFVASCSACTRGAAEQGHMFIV